MKPTLKKGSRGQLVIELQSFLNTNVKGLRSRLRLDGIFGSETAAVVKSYQAQVSIKQDGIVGPITWGKIVGAERARDDASSQLAARKVWPPVPTASLPMQTGNSHNCGYFASYFIAERELRKTVTGLRFSSDDALLAKRTFLSANDYPDTDLSPDNMNSYLQRLGCPNFGVRSCRGIFDHGDDLMTPFKFLLDRVGRSGCLVSVNARATVKHKDGSVNRVGHWFAIAEYKRTPQDTFFLVYDSGGGIPKEIKPLHAQASDTLCWAPAQYLIQSIQKWLPRAFVSRT